MLYTALKTLQLYHSQEYVPLPKGDKVGFENIVFLLSSSREKSGEILSSPFLAYFQSLYKSYYTDFIYNEKIGRKRIVTNKSSIIRKDFDALNLPHHLRLILPSSKESAFKKLSNTLIDLGEWNQLFFTNRLKMSVATICDAYISFIASKINDSFYNDYNKVIYIDINDWFIENSTIFGLSKAYLNNPISILLVSLYKYEDILKKLGNVTFLISDSKNKQFIKIDNSVLNKASFIRVKSKLLQLIALAEKKSPTFDTETDTENDSPDSELATSIMSKSQKTVADSRAKIINTLKKNLIGEVEDISDAYIEDEDQNIGDTSVDIDSKYNDEIDEVANDYLDKNPELLTEDPDIAAKEVAKEVIKQVYLSKFMPERSSEETEKINTLYGIQQNIIGTPSYTDLESKIIDTTDLSDVLITANPDIVMAKFKNFDSDYNTKKLMGDIDAAVGMLANASNKIFVIGKEEEDTSDQLNLKKTLTYHLQDEKGKKMSIKLDIPIIIDDKFIYLNGNKKILSHQLVLKPIVKTGPDTVQIVTFYNKIFVKRKNENDRLSSAIRKYLLSNTELYKVKTGNAKVKNKDIETPIEFDIIADQIYEFTIGDIRFITDIHELMQNLKTQNIKYSNINLDENILLGYNIKTKEVIFMNRKSAVYSDIILQYIPEDIQKKIRNIKISRLMYSQCTMLERDIPLVLFLLFCEGFQSVMKKANIEHKFVTDKEAKEYNDSEYGKIQLEDGILVWKRYPLQNSLLMNGFGRLETKDYSYEELESKDTYVAMISTFFEYATMAFNFEQYKDFMIDNTTREVLMDFNLPTDLVSLLLYANSWLKDNSFIPESNSRNIRVRSNELIPYFVYKAITSAYNPYRKTQHKEKPTAVSVKRNIIISEINDSQLTSDSSVLNPVLELEKNRSVTYKGKMGINLDQAMGLDKRAYNPTMLGIIGISTPDDSSVGILRQLTLEPKVTSTRGYIETTPTDQIDKLTSANLLTPAELLTPMAVQHDDPSRTAMK